MSGKKKHIALKILSVLFAALVLLICATPYLILREGSFVGESLKGLHSLFVCHAGFFRSPELQTITLLPLAVFVFMLTVETVFGVNFVYIFFETVVFCGFYIISAYIQGGGEYFASLAFLPKENWHYVGYVMILVSLVSLIFLSVKEIKVSKKSDDKNDEPEEDSDSEICAVEPFDVKTQSTDMSSDKALLVLNSLKVPEYKMFPNYTEDSSVGYVNSRLNPAGIGDSAVNPGFFAVASMDGDLHRQAMSPAGREAAFDRERTKNLSNLFKPRNITKKLQEEADIGKVFSDFDSSIDFDLSDVSAFTRMREDGKSVKEENNSIQEQKDGYKNDVPERTETAEIRQENISGQVERQPIVDEGSEGDESPEEAAEKYRKMTEGDKPEDKAGFDYISGVGGLRSSKDGSYVYDASKYRYQFPSESLLKHYETGERKVVDLANDADGQTIVDTLAQFRVETQLMGIQHGPTFTLYELALARGIRVNTVLGLADNIAMDLAVSSVRILAPIPGRSAIGIEVPNKKRDTIGFDMMMPALKSKTLKVPMVLGKTITGESIVIDLAGTPHLLIAGTTGSGKSVCVNSLICSILYTKTPREVRMILVDPKMVELSVYNDIPHLLTPVITDSKKAIKVMAFIVEEMERRMSMFSMLGARKIEDYNQKIKEKEYLRAQLPYIVVVIDEFADLMMAVGKELESYIKRITAMARFTGIHLVLATQRPSADVITGIIKSNIPTQIAFAVSNQTNSRIILDNMGAEKLLGKGDMLYQSASSREPLRIQGAYIDPEIEDIVNFVKTQGEPDYIDESYFEDDEEDENSDEDVSSASGGGEDLYMRAWKIVADRGEASASYLQRRLSIGYNRAANLIEQLEENGCIGPARGSKPREILRYPDSKSEQIQE